ncbi:Uncharacterised protein [Mycobacteroides abscessus subsp. abscessus]|nr:Uncharacterised protein [Mycobacteroides abscessus subsp. abscessus]
MNRWKNTSGSVSTAICALGRCPHCPFQSAMVIARVRSPVSSTSTVAERVWTSDGSSATAAAKGSCICARKPSPCFMWNSK